MTRMDYDLLTAQPALLNCLKSRELLLRDLYIQKIENLILTKNQYSAIDLTRNSIQSLDNLPLLTRLEFLLLSHNKISTIDPSISLPKLHTLNLSNNLINQLSTINNLSNLKSLEILILANNPICLLKHYRNYVINQLPGLKYLDFIKITSKERQHALEMFKSQSGLDIIHSIKNTFEPGLLEQTETLQKNLLSPAEIQKIKTALANAKTLDEITRLERLLDIGQPL